jgi:hypothetical protein
MEMPTFLSPAQTSRRYVHAAAQRTASHATAADPKDFASTVTFNDAQAFTQRPSERKEEMLRL